MHFVGMLLCGRVIVDRPGPNFWDCSTGELFMVPKKQAENEELEHIRKDLLTRNMNLVTELFSLQAQLAERDKTILEQQARIEEYEDIVDRLLQYNGGDVYYAYLDNDLSALEAHDREVKTKCLEEVAQMFRDAKSVGDGFERMANELKGSK